MPGSIVVVVGGESVDGAEMKNNFHENIETTFENSYIKELEYNDGFDYSSKLSTLSFFKIKSCQFLRRSSAMTKNRASKTRKKDQSRS